MSGNQAEHRADKKQRIVGAFDRAAATYDQIGPRFFSYFGQRLVQQAQIQPGAHVLDVACGRGAVLFSAAQAVGPTGRVIGIDLSPSMVSETQKECQQMKLGNASLRQMDAERLEFADSTFDWVLSGLGLLFFPRPGLALSEMQRVLKPGGQLALSTWDGRGDDYWRWFEEDLYHSFMPQMGGPAQPAEEEAASIEFDTPETLANVMVAAGFTAVRVVEESIDMVFRSEQEWWDALWTNSMRIMLEELEQATGPEGLEKFKLAALERVKTMRQADGIHQWWPVLFALATKPNPG